MGRLAWILALALVLVPARSKAQEQAGGEGVYNVVDLPTTIQTLKRVGTQVKKGDIVCELESFPLRARLESQEAALKTAEGPYQNAKSAREVAELAVTQYLEAVYKPQIQKLEAQISLAESAVKSAEHRVATARRLVEKGLRPRTEIQTAELGLQRAKLDLDKALGKKSTLEKYTKERKVKELQSAVERAKSEELARQAAVGQEQAAIEQLKKQIEGCKVLAPADGRIHYQKPIEEGAEVRKGQLLFRVVPAAGAGESPGASLR
jgi:multidrug resistance efflux pump